MDVRLKPDGVNTTNPRATSTGLEKDAIITYQKGYNVIKIITHIIKILKILKILSPRERLIVCPPI